MRHLYKKHSGIEIMTHFRFVQCAAMYSPFASAAIAYYIECLNLIPILHSTREPVIALY